MAPSLLSPSEASAIAPVDALVKMGLGYMTSSALHVVVELGIVDRLADGPRSADQLALDAGANADALFRVMRMLSAEGIFEETAPRQFALTPQAQPLRTGGAARDLIHWIADPFHFKVYSEALHAVRTGQPAVEFVTGLPVFDHIGRTPELAEAFNNAMTSFSAVVIPAVIEAYDFTGIDVLVDVAGGHGRVLTSILKAYPKMRGVLFDLPYVVEGARPMIAELGLGHRCRAEAGDMFANVPASGDAYILKHIIHDWDDRRALAILSNIRQAMRGRRGKVILIESVIEAGNQPDMGKFIDYEMLQLTGGLERTEDQFRTLFAEAGFALTRIVPTTSPLSVVEAEAI
jgi:O-methyltransferase domain